MAKSPQGQFDYAAPSMADELVEEWDSKKMTSEGSMLYT